MSAGAGDHPALVGGAVPQRRVEVRGNASAEELAAVLAVVAHFEHVERAHEPDRYADWRKARLAALKHSWVGARPACCPPSGR